MLKRPYLWAVAILLMVSGALLAGVPTFQSFDPGQFSSTGTGSGQLMHIASGAIITNTALQGLTTASGNVSVTGGDLSADHGALLTSVTGQPSLDLEQNTSTGVGPVAIFTAMDGITTHPLISSNGLFLGDGSLLTNLQHAGSFLNQTNQIPLFADNFNRGSLGANWALHGNVTATITANALNIGTTIAGGTGDYLQCVAWPTLAQYYTVTFTAIPTSVISGSTFGMQFGFHSIEASASGNDLAFGIGYQTGGVGNTYIFSGTVPSPGLGSIGRGSTMPFLAQNDVTQWTITRDKWGMRLFVTNVTEGGCGVLDHTLNSSDISQGAENTTANPAFYVTGGNWTIDNFSYVYNGTTNQPWYVIGNSIDSGYYAIPGRDYRSLLDSVLIGGCKFYGASSATMEGIFACSNELNLVMGTNTRVIYVPPGNSIAGGIAAATWTNEYKNLPLLWTNHGALYYVSPPARNAFDMTTADLIIAGIATNFYVSGYAATRSNLSTVLPNTYDHLDGIHPSTAGHFAIYAAISRFLYAINPAWFNPTYLP